MRAQQGTTFSVILYKNDVTYRPTSFFIRGKRSALFCYRGRTETCTCYRGCRRITFSVSKYIRLGFSNSEVISQQTWKHVPYFLTYWEYISYNSKIKYLNLRFIFQKTCFCNNETVHWAIPLKPNNGAGVKKNHLACRRPGNSNSNHNLHKWSKQVGNMR